MPILSSAANSLEETARLAGCHYAVGTNSLIRSVVNPQWSSSGHWSDSAVVGAGNNITDTTRLPRRVFDFILWEFTRPTSANGLPAIYLLFDLTAGTDDDQTTDFIMIKPVNFTAVGPMTVRVRFADDQDFSSFGEAPLGGIVAEAVSVQSNRALVFSSLIAGLNGRVYQNVRYARIDIFLTSGSNFGAITPAISEVVFGKKRQFAHRPRIPYDPTAHRSGADDFNAKAGSTTRDINFERQSVVTARFKPHPNNFANVDEAANLNALLAADTKGGLRPFFYCTDPTNQTNPLLGRDAGRWVIMPSPEKIMPFVNKTAQEIELQLIEQQPFYLAET